MRTPLVSVLIPVFNGEPFLAECLESILAQDLGDYEVLISDDGSTDGSAAVIQRYAARDSRIRWWRNPRNLGIGGNFNAGLKAARGEFLKYVLQDDKLLDPSALRRMVAPMEKDASVSLVGSASHLIDSRSRLLEVRNRFRRSGVRDGKRIIIYCLEHNGNLIGEPSLVLFRKSQSARGFDEQLVQLLDLEMWFYLLEQGRFAYLAEPLCAFRQHPAQLTEVNRRSGASAEEDLPFVGKILHPALDEGWGGAATDVHASILFAQAPGRKSRRVARRYRPDVEPACLRHLVGVAQADAAFQQFPAMARKTADPPLSSRNQRTARRVINRSPRSTGDSILATITCSSSC